ncbi:MAG: hypothetical protein GX928_02055 [Ruminococcaceae bacterium]|nr:hypothetical protein [Oscillospiraceae bacterium]
MKKYCGNCGLRLDLQTGLCPNCHPKQERVVQPYYQQHKVGNDNMGVVTHQKKRGSRRKRLIAVFVSLVIVLNIIVGIFVLSYFNIVNIPIASNIISLLTNKTDNTYSQTDEYFLSVSKDMISSTITDKESALDTIDTIYSESGQKAISENLDDCRISDVKGTTYYRFSQQYKGIPVYGRTVAVCVDENDSFSILSGNYRNIEKLSTNPTVTESEIIKVIEKKYGKEVKMYNLGLIIYSFDEKPELAYECNVSNSECDDKCILSANTGKFIDILSNRYYKTVRGSGLDLDGNLQEFNTELEDGSYYMKDIPRNIEMIDAKESTLDRELYILGSDGKKYFYKNGKLTDENGSKVQSESIHKDSKIYHIIRDMKGNLIEEKGELWIKFSTKNVFTFPSYVKNNSTLWNKAKYKKPISLYTKVARVFDFWKENFGLYGYDNRSSKMYIAFNDNLYSGNYTYALSVKDFDVALLSFGKNEELTNDVIAHEYMHTVTQQIADFQYKGEPGAICEAYSDIFGEIFEDWADDNTFNNTCDWFVFYRNLMNPLSNGYPNRQGGPNWIGPNDTAVDKERVYNNSTVISHAAFLMSEEAGESTDSLETPLSTEKIAELFFKTLHILPSNCSFHTFGENMIEKAKQMYDEQRLTAGEYRRVIKSLVRVNIRDPRTSGKDLDWLNQSTNNDSSVDDNEFLLGQINEQSVTIDAGWEHAVGLKNDGTVVVAGGSAFFYEVDDSFMQNFPSAVIRDNGSVWIPTNMIEGVRDWKDIISVGAGPSFTVGLKSDGTVVKVVDEISVIDPRAPNRSDEEWSIERWTDIVAISVSGSITGLKSDGTVVIALDNLEKDFGADHVNRIETEVSSWQDIVAITIENFLVGIRQDGTVVTTGSLYNSSYYKPDVSSWSDIVAISAGNDHIVGLKSDGTVVAVGKNNRLGQLDVGNWTDIVAISAAGYCTVGLKSDGTVVAVGFNNDGKLDVNSWTDIVDISVNEFYTLGLKSDGTVVCAGKSAPTYLFDIHNWTDIAIPERHRR